MVLPLHPADERRVFLSLHVGNVNHLFISVSSRLQPAFIKINDIKTLIINCAVHPLSRAATLVSKGQQRPVSAAWIFTQKIAFLIYNGWVKEDGSQVCCSTAHKVRF